MSRPKEIAEERFARGEITEKEYDALIQRLSTTETASSEKPDKGEKNSFFNRVLRLVGLIVSTILGFIIVFAALVALNLIGDGASEDDRSNSFDPNQKIDTYPNVSGSSGLKESSEMPVKKLKGRVPPLSLYDTRTDKETRIAELKMWLIGDWHVQSYGAHWNLTLKEDGTASQSSCSIRGEVWERSYDPPKTAKWDIAEERYESTGKIFYVLTDEGNYPEGLILSLYQIDRNNGFVQFVGGPNRKALYRGKRKDCPD